VWGIHGGADYAKGDNFYPIRYISKFIRIDIYQTWSELIYNKNYLNTHIFNIPLTKVV
jgi:hypothetical protein